MERHDTDLTIEELAERTDTPIRTVRYYIAEKMLPGPGSRGKGAAYTEEHLLRLRLIRRLTERREPLAGIREMMARITVEEVRALLAEEDTRAQTLERAERAVSPKAYISALLDQARAPRVSQTTRAAQAAQVFQPPPGAYVAAPSTPSPQASAWRRVELARGVELHIALEAEERNRSLIERLLQISEGHQDA